MSFFSIRVNSCFIAITVILFLCINCYSFDDVGFQYWTGTKLTTNLDENTKFTFTEEFRLGDDGGNLYRHHSDFGVVFKSVFENVDLGLNYMQVFEKDSQDIWKEEYRPHLNLTAKGKLFGLDIADRSRLEFRDRESKDNLWRYRNKITINRPFEYIDSETLQKFRERYRLYVADEIFFNLDGSGYSRNRIYTGVIIKLSNNMAGDLYYLWQSDDTNSDTKEIHVLGFKLLISF